MNQQALKQPLLSDNEQYDSLKLWSLPFCLILSSLGMIVLKTAQISKSTFALIIGISLELSAYAAYPIAMYKYSLRTISVCWTGSGLFTAIISGMILFNESPSLYSFIGCVFVIMGMILQLF